MRSIYFVFNPEGNVPKHEHPTFESAEKEALRLAEKEKGKTFYVCRAIQSVKYVTNPIVREQYCARKE